MVDTGLFVTFEPNLCSLTQQRGQKAPNYLKIQTKLWLCPVAQLPPYLFGPHRKSNRRPRARRRDAQPQESARCSSCVRCTLHGNARLCSLMRMIVAIIDGTDTANSHRESNLVSKSAAAVVFLRAILPRVQLHKATFLSKQLIIDITPILG